MDSYDLNVSLFYFLIFIPINMVIFVALDLFDDSNEDSAKALAFIVFGSALAFVQGGILVAYLDDSRIDAPFALFVVVAAVSLITFVVLHFVKDHYEAKQRVADRAKEEEEERERRRWRDG